MEKNEIIQPQMERSDSARVQEGRVSRMQTRRRWLVPAVNIYETPTEFVIEAEMPGVNREGLEVLLEGHELTIRGRRCPETGEGRYLVRERDIGLEYRRRFELDPALDPSKVSARLEQGLLTLVLPKAEAFQPRRIPVTD
ncbi:MAG: Hsp20/alpha crystallin family protein [Verrucomicrobiota bacterium]|nr:Hsp20/alpha crystallin family protein [Limisphaera sp.]MDW8380515.1 Hsp20/alpha crystallin family protein [Verrucomicrobiota bacterium]